MGSGLHVSGPIRHPNDPICAQFSSEIRALQNEIAALQKDMQHAAGSEKMPLIREIVQDDIKLAALQKQKQQNGRRETRYAAGRMCFVQASYVLRHKAW